MFTVVCHGTPYEIGQQHGRAARAQVHGTKDFYEAFFRTMSGMEWDEVTVEASKWLPLLKGEYHQYVEEMQDATDLPLSTIIALNVRTEVAFGLYSDGCTAIALHQENNAILAQNWDWKGGQKANLINLVIKDQLSIVTEAGIIGKIGVSAGGVGVALNAIVGLGISHNRIPVHIALRASLDWSNQMPKGGRKARAIVDRLKAKGVASAGHILVADEHEGIGLEVSYRDAVEVGRTSIPKGSATLHTNHYLETHPGVTEKTAYLLSDSPTRMARIQELLNDDKDAIDPACVWAWLSDEQGFPGSICRDAQSPGGSETLFSIVMDLKSATAEVKVGKPNSVGESFRLDPRVS